MRIDFEQLYQTALIAPAVNQIEFHPYLQRPDLVAYCRAHDVAVEAWSPLMRGKVEAITELAEIGARHGKSAAQVTIRWILQRGIITIPKTTHDTRLHENADVFDFSLSAEEMALIDSLDRG
jgi:diketogulonate reductase-like aldo/keto reductase